MRPQTVSTGTTQGFANRALLGLELATLLIGALHYFFLPNSFQRPLLAFGALALLTTSVVLLRAVPSLRRSSLRQHSLAITVLIAVIAALSLASGGVHSPAMALFAVPMTALALAFGRWWLVLLLAAPIALIVYGLGAMTPGADYRSTEFAVLHLSRLAPALVVAIVLALLIDRMHGAVQRISDLASTDALTGLLNLRAFDQVLQQEHRKAERFGRSYTLLMIDIDNLAQINEALGHDAGNQILVAVASAIDRSIRGTDVAARLGGDEFIVLLTEADTATGASIGQRVRNNVFASTVSVANRLLRANVSVGAATFPGDHLYSKELMVLADQRMQQDRELRKPAATD